MSNRTGMLIAGLLTVLIALVGALYVRIDGRFLASEKQEAHAQMLKVAADEVRRDCQDSEIGLMDWLLHRQKPGAESRDALVLKVKECVRIGEITEKDAALLGASD